MFGPEHPRPSGTAGLPDGDDDIDGELPGFGPFGTAGAHCFDDDGSVYGRASALLALRAMFPALRKGRQYARQVSVLGGPFRPPAAGELIAWSRILDDEELLCVLNPNGVAERGGRVIVDATLNPPGSEMTVVLGTAGVGAGSGGAPAAGARVRVQRSGDGSAWVDIPPLGPSEALVLANHPGATEGGAR
jgi:hypothetical protein